MLVENLVTIVVVLAKCHRPVFGDQRRQSLRVGSVGRLQHFRAAPERRDTGRCDRAQHPGSVRGDPVTEPPQIRHHPDQAARSGGQRHRPEGAAEELGVQGVHRRGDLLGRAAACQPVGQRGADLRREVPQLGGVARREQKQCGGNADHQRQHPAVQSLVQRSGRGAHRQQEHHQHGALPAGDHLAEQAQDGHRRPDHEAQRDHDPWMRGRQGAHRDEDRADHGQTGVGQGAGRDGAGEVGRDHQRHGSDKGEHRRLRVSREQVGDGRGERDGDRGAHRPAQRVVARVAGAQPVGDPPRTSHVGTSANRPASRSSSMAVQIHSNIPRSFGSVDCS